MERQVIIQPDPKSVAHAFTDLFLHKLKSKDRFNIALSGGSTPRILFELWATDFAQAIDWRKLHFFWGDERCVPPADEQSNYGVAKALLFDRIELAASQIHRVMGESNPADEASRYEKEILDHVAVADGLPRFDLVLLGMGNDGHTASLFPHEMELLKSNHVCAVATHPESGQKRVTLTGKIINNAAHVVFLITGQGKAGKVAEVIDLPDDSQDYPATHINPVGELTFLVDKDAAALLERRS